MLSTRNWCHNFRNETRSEFVIFWKSLNDQMETIIQKLVIFRNNIFNRIEVSQNIPVTNASSFCNTILYLSFY